MPEEKKPKLTPVWENFVSSLTAWWKHLKKFIMVYVWGLLFGIIPLAAAALVMWLNNWLGGSNSAAGNVIIAVIVFIAALVALYYFIRGSIGAVLLVKKNYEGDELAIFQETAEYFWPYIGLVLLTAVFVLLWSLLLVIPGIIYSVFYAFACFAFFWEGKLGRAAIRRSRELVAHYWWPVFGRVCFLGIITWAFTLIVSLPVYFVSVDSVFFQLWNILVQVISFLIGPIFLIFYYNIYRDLVKIKDHQA